MSSLSSSRGDGLVDELRAVVGVKAQDAKRKLAQHVL